MSLRFLRDTIKMLEKFLRRDAVEALTGLSRAAIYAGMKAGTFPTTIRIGKSAVAWRESDLEAWQLARIASTRSGKAA